jgi:hypothetical protein
MMSFHEFRAPAALIEIKTPGGNQPAAQSAVRKCAPKLIQNNFIRAPI